MDPALNLPPLDVPGLLRAHHLSPQKSLGQNFLLDQGALRRVAEAAEIQPEDEVLEIGAGLGSLTRVLAQLAARVVAVELDRHLLPILEEVLAPQPNVEIVPGDMLELNPADLMHRSGYIVAANIPYYITSALIRHLLEASIHPSRMVLTIQREVALRICADPGDLSLLALSVQVYGHPSLAARIPAGAFYPPPKVDSAVLKIDLYAEPRILPAQLDAFFLLAKAGFGQKRKTLRNSLSSGLGWKSDRTATLLNTAGIDPQRRAETLSLDEWNSLTSAYLAE